MDLARDAEEVAGQLDELVAPAGEPENAVLVDNARVVRWAGPAFVLFSLILLPWIVYLAHSLPSRQLSADYDAVWAGFDVMLLAALASTGYFAFRRSPYLATAGGWSCCCAGAGRRGQAGADRILQARRGDPQTARVTTSRDSALIVSPGPS